jgi:hypothetical protein
LRPERGKEKFEVAYQSDGAKYGHGLDVDWDKTPGRSAGRKNSVKNIGR